MVLAGDWNVVAEDRDAAAGPQPGRGPVEDVVAAGLDFSILYVLRMDEIDRVDLFHASPGRPVRPGARDGERGHALAQVAEHALAMVFSLAARVHLAHDRSRGAVPATTLRLQGYRVVRLISSFIRARLPRPDATRPSRSALQPGALQTKPGTPRFSQAVKVSAT